MRISDWSSDVCSSDLGIAGRRRESVAQCVSRACAGRDRAAGRRGHAGMAGTGDAAALRRRRMKRELAAMLAAAGLIGAGLWSVAAASKGGKGGTGYEHKLTGIDGTPMTMVHLRGKVVLLVNTASFRGLTTKEE